MLSIRQANDNEVKIFTDLLKDCSLSGLDYNTDGEDNIGFVSGYDILIRVEFQIIKEGPVFASFTLGNHRYDIHHPEGELKDRLIKIAEEAKKRTHIGETLKEKIDRYRRLH